MFYKYKGFIKSLTVNISSIGLNHQNKIWNSSNKPQSTQLSKDKYKKPELRTK